MTTHEDRKKLICETQQFLPTTTSTITTTKTATAADGGALFLVWLRAGKNNSSRENICEALNNASQVWGAACCAFSPGRGLPLMVETHFFGLHSETVVAVIDFPR